MADGKYDTYVSVMLNKDEVSLLRELCKKIEEPSMRGNLTHRFDAAFLQFGTPVHETKVKILDSEEQK